MRRTASRAPPTVRRGGGRSCRNCCSSLCSWRSTSTCSRSRWPIGRRLAGSLPVRLRDGERAGLPREGPPFLRIFVCSPSEAASALGLSSQGAVLRSRCPSAATVPPAALVLGGPAVAGVAPPLLL